MGRLIAEAHERFKENTDGQNSQVYPALLAIIPCSRLPDYRPGEIPGDEEEPQAARA